MQRVPAHPAGAVLYAVADQDRIVTGGDDGRIVATRADGMLEERAQETGWIDAVTALPCQRFCGNNFAF